MLGCQVHVGEELLHAAKFSHPDARRPQVVGPGPEVNRCETLTEESPPCLENVKFYQENHNIFNKYISTVFAAR